MRIITNRYNYISISLWEFSLIAEFQAGIQNCLSLINQGAMELKELFCMTSVSPLSFLGRAYTIFTSSCHLKNFSYNYLYFINI
jgi:hypothetical protein